MNLIAYHNQEAALLQKAQPSRRSDNALRKAFELALEHFFNCNPHLPFHVWSTTVAPHEVAAPQISVWNLPDTQSSRIIHERVGRQPTAPDQCRPKLKNIMLIKSNKKASDVAPEGEYPAELKGVAYKNEGKKCVLDFEINPAGKPISVPKEAQASFDSGSLRKDLEILNGQEFTRKQIEQGVDPENFVGHKCRALVVHKRTSGGRVVAVVSVLLPLLVATATRKPSAPTQETAPQSDE